MLGTSAAYAFCNLDLVYIWGTAFEIVVGLALMKDFQSVHSHILILHAHITLS